MSKPSAFKHDLQTSSNPATLVRETYGACLIAMTWIELIADRPPKRFSTAYEPQLRLAEPDVPDVEGHKYIVVGPDYRSKNLPIVDAVEQLLERENHQDRIVVEGSMRPIAEWKIPDGMTVHGVFPCWVGVTVEEGRRVESTVGDTRNSAATVLLRIRMRKGSYARIKKAAEYERLVYKDGGKNQCVSTFCLVPIMEKVEQIEAAHRTADAAEFSGTLPAASSNVNTDEEETEGYDSYGYAL